MEDKVKTPFLFGIPSWVSALLTMFLAFIALMVVSDIIIEIFNIKESDAAEIVFYSLYNLIIAAGCFYICRNDPNSIWYVPVLCNIVGIFSAIVEPTFWTSSLWIIICSGWVLSLIASILGVQSGKKKLISSEQ